MNIASLDFHQSQTVDEEAKAKLKYQTLANEFLELQKEFVSKKRKLKIAKHKRDKFFAEVRFLRRRHKYLCRIKDSNKRRDLLHLQNLDEEMNAVEGERNHIASEVAAGNSDEETEDDGGQHQVLEKEPRFADGVKSVLTHDKVVGKRKISRHDQYTLQETEDDGGQHQVLEKEPRFANGLESVLTHDKVVSKRKISRHDQYTLQV